MTTHDDQYTCKRCGQPVPYTTAFSDHLRECRGVEPVRPSVTPLTKKYQARLEGLLLFSGQAAGRRAK